MQFLFVIWASAPMYGDRAMGGMNKELFFDVQGTYVAGHSSQHNITQHGTLPQHPTGTTKLICDYF